MTFPLMSGALIRLFPDHRAVTLTSVFHEQLRRCHRRVVSGFLFVPIAGLPGAILLAAIINLVLAVVVLFLSKEMSAQNFGAFCRPYLAMIQPLRLFLAASLITGASSFLYEIGWIRMLSLVLGSSTHAFELMLSAFIAGLALGGLWIKGRIDRCKKPVRCSARCSW